MVKGKCLGRNGCPEVEHDNPAPADVKPGVIIVMVRERYGNRNCCRLSGNCHPDGGNMGLFWHKFSIVGSG
ncbi:hypothetical protein Dda3937_02138 [Dickeya dadantii 3937]|uniref:Uncharacterized protein n=1 Tax=Dickeya dadantii (strain 3937) TaxID=198628 RepID=E0SI36_DICD3|nr:hypothetical protein Dda3937_02138 [Dickeya dadantii 3937]